MTMCQYDMSQNKEDSFTNDRLFFIKKISFPNINDSKFL